MTKIKNALEMFYCDLFTYFSLILNQRPLIGGNKAFYYFYRTASHIEIFERPKNSRDEVLVYLSLSFRQRNMSTQTHLA